MAVSPGHSNASAEMARATIFLTDDDCDPPDWCSIAEARLRSTSRARCRGRTTTPLPRRRTLPGRVFALTIFFPIPGRPAGATGSSTANVAISALFGVMAASGFGEEFRRRETATRNRLSRAGARSVDLDW